MKIYTVKDFGRALRDGPYTSVGGYPVFFLTADGATFSFATAWKERSQIVQAILDDDKHGGWRVVASDVNWEDAEMFDEHSGRRIESAYAEDDAEGEPEKTPKSYLDWRRKSR